jgi:dihydrofolate reductase
MTAKLIYVATRSLDGYIADKEGKLAWSMPDPEGHRFINDLLRPVGTYLYGRRMYETMQVWETQLGTETDPAWARDFAKMWRAADKIVYSKTVKQVSTARTRIEQTFDADRIRELKSRAEHDLGMGGHELAAHAFKAGLVDEINVFMAPVIIGGGTPSLPDGLQLDLELVDERRFKESGIVHLQYRRRTL